MSKTNSTTNRRRRCWISLSLLFSCLYYSSYLLAIVFEVLPGSDIVNPEYLSVVRNRVAFWLLVSFLALMSVTLQIKFWHIIIFIVGGTEIYTSGIPGFIVSIFQGIISIERLISKLEIAMNYPIVISLLLQYQVFFPLLYLATLILTYQDWRVGKEATVEI